MSDLLAILDQLDEARAKATPGPWQQGDAFDFAVWNGRTSAAIAASPSDAALIVAAVNAAPKLTAALRAVLAMAEQWRYKGEFGYGAWQEGHGPDLEGQVLDDAAADLRKAITAALTPEATS